jgi:hypothetical protein
LKLETEKGCEKSEEGVAGIIILFEFFEWLDDEAVFHFGAIWDLCWRIIEMISNELEPKSSKSGN